MPPEIYTIGLPTPFAVGDVNVYAIYDGELTLVDAGPRTEAAEAALEQGLERLGFSVGQVRRILITHGHQDHFGLAGRLRARSGAEILLPEADQHLTSQPYPTEFYRRALIQAGLPEEEVTPLTQAFLDIRSFSDPIAEYRPVRHGDRIPLRRGVLQVLRTPGHTPGSLCYYWPGPGVLFAGDTLLKSITPNPVLDVDPTDRGHRYPSLVRYLETLHDLLPVAAETIYTGHREAITDYPGHYQTVLAFYRERQGRILDLLRGGAKSAYEVSRDLFPAADGINRFLAVSEVLANLDLLKHHDRLRSGLRGPVEYFATDGAGGAPGGVP